MGGGSGGSDCGGIGSDWEVGTIVWVRRRNGSWWPGRILGQHELSASHLMSPRSGTPVKLLGREDASVDWYNLEKSKRVKAFRCGEFDACIERAEASQGFPVKKREKYARREDAILHALELEKQTLERRHQRLGNNFSSKRSRPRQKEQSMEFPAMGGFMADETPIIGKLINYRKVDSTFHSASKGMSFTDKRKNDILFSHEDGNSDVEHALRKRGFRDIDLPAISSKSKLAPSGSYGSSKVPLLVSNFMHSPSMKDTDRWNDVGRRKISQPVERRSQVGHNEVSISKAWGKGRPQALPITAEFPTSESMPSCGYESDLQVWPTHFEKQRFLEKENMSSEPLEPYESDLSERLYLDSDVEHDESSLPSNGTSKIFVPQRSGSGRKSESDHQKLRTQGLSATRKKDGMLLSRQSTGSSAEAGVSRWNLKRKRNIRRTSRREVKSIGVNCMLSSHEHERGIDNAGIRNPAGTMLDSQTDDSGDSDLIEKESEAPSHLTEYLSCKPVLHVNSLDSKGNSMNGSDTDSCEMSLSDWDSEKQICMSRRWWEGPPQRLGHFYSGQFGDTLESLLVDVDLKVQASYLGERVPLISLMSRLDGKAIVGHPIRIEILSDGFTASLLQEADHSETVSSSPGWPTAKRTTLSRIPRPRAASPPMEDLEGGLPHLSNQESGIPLESEPIIFVKKGCRGYGPSKKVQKSPKKASQSSLKTRTLLPSARGQKISSLRESGTGCSKVDSLGKLIEPGDAMLLVACIPTKVVFSRILEAVGRSPSMAAMHRHNLTAATVSNNSKPQKP